MKHVAFLRNVNLGQRGSPTRTQFEAAFLLADAATAVSFLSNGTLIFTVAKETDAAAVASRAVDILRESCGLAEPTFVRSMQRLVDLAAQDPYTEYSGPPYAGCLVTFFEPRPGITLTAPIRSPSGNCVVFSHRRGRCLLRGSARRG